jgi:hypothetical protein
VKAVQDESRSCEIKDSAKVNRMVIYTDSNEPVIAPRIEKCAFPAQVGSGSKTFLY